MTTTQRNTERAVVLAEEYRVLVRRGDLPRADQVRRTIDDLCGRPLGRGRVAHPARVAQLLRQADR